MNRLCMAVILAQFNTAVVLCLNDCAYVLESGSGNWRERSDVFLLDPEINGVL